jgi:hypothetical protein
MLHLLISLLNFSQLELSVRLCTSLIIRRLPFIRMLITLSQHAKLRW